MSEDFDFLFEGGTPLLPSEWIDQHGFEEPLVRENASLRFGVYARRSIADPRNISIKRQVSLCADYLKSIGATFDRSAHLFIDRNLSGSTMSGRAALKALLEAADQGLIDGVVVEDVDRLSRDLGDICVIQRRLERLGVQIHAAGRGRLSNHVIAISGVLAQRERERMIESTSAGQLAAAEAGRFLAGRSLYGYDRPPQGGRWTINEDQAAVIRRAAELFDGGMLATPIAKLFNAEGIPAPGGGKWTAGCLFGTGTRLCGILDRRILIGLFVWGRNGTSDTWRVQTEVPELAILDDAIFHRLQERRRAGKVGPRPASKGTRLFVGTVMCTCGARMRALRKEGNSRGSFVCSDRVLRGTCTRTNNITIAELERRALHVLKHVILDPANLHDFEELRRRERGRCRAEIAAERGRLLNEIERIETELDLDDPGGDETFDMAAVALQAEREREYLRLTCALEKLPTSVDDEPLSAPEAADLRGAITSMLTALPYVASTPDEVRMVGRLRELMPRIVVEQHPDKSFSLRCVLGVPGLPADENVIDRAPPDLWIERSYPRPPTGALRHAERVLEAHKLAEPGAFDLSDREWAALEQLFAPCQRLAIGAREYANATIFLAKTRLPTPLLPERYARQCMRAGWFRKLGIWPRMIQVLEDLDSPLLEDLDRSRFAELPPGVRNWRRRPYSYEAVGSEPSD